MEPARTPDRALATGALISFLACVLVWSLMRNTYIPFWDAPLNLFTPDSWYAANGEPVMGTGGMRAKPIYELLFVSALLYGFGRLGSWRTAWSRLIVERGPWVQVLTVVPLAWVTLLLVDNHQLPLRQLVFAFLPYGTDQEANLALDSTAKNTIDVAVVLAFAWLGGAVRLLRRPVRRRRPARAVPGLHLPRSRTRTPCGGRSCGPPGWGRWPSGWRPRPGAGG